MSQMAEARGRDTETATETVTTDGPAVSTEIHVVTETEIVSSTQSRVVELTYSVTGMVTVTQTVTTTHTVTTPISTVVRKAKRDEPEVPGYASKCKSFAAYQSACSRLGVFPTTVSVAESTATVTVTETLVPEWTATGTTTVTVTESAVETVDITTVTSYTFTTSTVTATATTTAIVIPQLEILGATFGTADITSYALTNWKVGSNIVINTNKAYTDIGLNAPGDLMTGQPRSITVLYRWGTEVRSWVGRWNSGTYTITPTPNSAAPSGSLVVPNYPRPQGITWIQILEVNYGLGQNRNQTLWNKLYLDAAAGVGTPLINENFGDTWYSIEKSGVVWYRDTRNGPDGPLHLAATREGRDLQLMRADGSFS
ncbi:uncharacterized protein CTHT_0065140 [Thermochaetoides thermophila DSM 1495]|uniref:Uncharacterized protein n=1 Tax=Chaetomium thermophilum (strain DSM 1495 / CBS 144.50 / IMI 039719) TaxID=759272 RepID=G0SG59_CHATD|nr:hypothetical protein CTHT_0065140 [Thermochaetoides thermophila DSM 1495]EGS17198.1 hypothetical protein CTHT_0065140 [Thermochaetoides thermophila DSM 1495]